MRFYFFVYKTRALHLREDDIHNDWLLVYKDFEEWRLFKLIKLEIANGCLIQMRHDSDSLKTISWVSISIFSWIWLPPMVDTYVKPNKNNGNEHPTIGKSSLKWVLLST